MEPRTARLGTRHRRAKKSTRKSQSRICARAAAANVAGMLVTSSATCTVCSKKMSAYWVLRRIVGKSSAMIGSLAEVCMSCADNGCTYGTHPTGGCGPVCAVLSSDELVCAAHADCLDPAPRDVARDAAACSVVACSACGFTGACDQRPGEETRASCSGCNLTLCALCADDPDIARETAHRFGHDACAQ